MAISFKPVGGDAYTIKMKMAASQTIAEGDPVTVSSGVVSLASAGAASIFGIAAEDAASEASGNYYMKVYPADDTIFECTLTSDGSTEEDITVAKMWTATGACYDLAGGTGAFYVDSSATADDLFKIVGVPGDIENDALTSTIHVRVNKSQFMTDRSL